LVAPLAPEPPLYFVVPMLAEASPPAAPVEILFGTLEPPLAMMVLALPNQESPPADGLELPAPTVTV
jgi:hypothetical protein